MVAWETGAMGGPQAQGHARGQGGYGSSFRPPSPVRPPMDEYEHGLVGGVAAAGLGVGGAVPLSKGDSDAGSQNHYAQMNALLRELHFARIQRHPMLQQHTDAQQR